MSLDELMRGPIANWVYGTIRRDITRQLEMNGKVPPRFSEDVLRALIEAAGKDLTVRVTAIGRPVARVETDRWSSVHEVARESGLSERTVRRLAQSGQVRARRVGDRVWQIDAESFENVMRRRAA